MLYSLHISSNTNWFCVTFLIFNCTSLVSVVPLFKWQLIDKWQISLDSPSQNNVNKIKNAMVFGNRKINGNSVDDATANYEDWSEWKLSIIETFAKCSNKSDLQCSVNNLSDLLLHSRYCSGSMEVWLHCKCMLNFTFNLVNGHTSSWQYHQNT